MLLGAGPGPYANGPGPYQIFDFQQAVGTRQVVVTFDKSLWYYTWVSGTQLSAATLIEGPQANDAQPWSMVESTQIMFAANGLRMMYWTGLNWWTWGLSVPTVPPSFGSPSKLCLSIQRAANVVTFTLRNTAAAPHAFAAMYLRVGDPVTVANPADPSFNGTFIIATVVVPGLTYTYAQVAANSGPFANVALVTVTSASGVIPGVNGSRTNGVATYVFAPQVDIIASAFVGSLAVISGYADATLNGTFPVATATVAGDFGTGQFTVLQPGLPDSAGAANGVVTIGVTIANFRDYAYSFFNGTVGHQGNMGPSSRLLGPLTNRIVYVGGPLVFPDPQINAYQIYATLDGGGDFFQDPSGGIPGASGTIIRDFTNDAGLNVSVQGPLINNPPPVGHYLTVGQSRIFVANLVGDPTAIAYSGYEQILVGRPEMAFPPNNRLRLKIGAEAVMGIGVLQVGVVAFSATKKMYMLRGQVEDISIAAPVVFSAFLEELPWNIGTLCHQSIQATPYGLLFWGTDKTVQLFDGAKTLKDISRPVYPILRRATRGFESVASSAYFNWLERDWYGLSFPVDGSATNNFTIFWSLTKESGQIDIFPCSIGMDCLYTLTTSDMQRILAIGQQGNIMNLPVSQDTVNGISDKTTIPATGGALGAYWRGGYFGNDSPTRSKTWRTGRVVSDIPGFAVTVRVVDDRVNKITNPMIMDKEALDEDGRFAVNMRGTRLSVEINFPDADVSANVLEMSMGAVGTSDRI